MAAGLPLWIIFPKRRREEQVASVDTVSMKPEPCTATTPTPAGGTEFVVEYRAAGLREAVTVRARSDGRYNGGILDRLPSLASWCEDLDARVVLALPAIPSHLPANAESPPRTWSGEALQLRFDSPTNRPTLSSFQTDVVMARMSKACCERGARARKARSCEAECAEAAGVAVCNGARDECLGDAEAAEPELRSAGARYCRKLYLECIQERGATTETLEKCASNWSCPGFVDT